jgi:hypothetical protein
LKVVNDLAQKAPRYILPRAEALGYGFVSKENIRLATFLLLIILFLPKNKSNNFNDDETPA